MSKNKTFSITVLQTADIHGQIDTHQELFVENGKITFRKRGGLAHIKTLFEQEKKANPGRTIIVDGGDMIQGSGYAALSEGKIFSDIVKNMGYDLLIPGNWEVVYGKKIMLEVMKNYQTHVIAENMKHEKSGKHLFPPYWIKEIEGIRLGFIGVNDPDIPERQNPKFSKGIAFSGLDKSIKTLIAKMKKEEKVDVVFLITHIGIFKQVALSNEFIAKDVDYILGNDTHERIRKPIQGKYAKVTEPGAFGAFVGKLTLNFKNGELVSDEYELIEVDPEKYPADKELQKIIDKAKKPYQKELEEVVGSTATPLYRYIPVQTPLDNFITDAMRWKTGADISLSNGFRFGYPIVPENGKPTPINKNDIWCMLPVNEKVKTGEVTGKQLKEWLEKEANNVFARNFKERFGGWLVRFSGMEVELDTSKPKGRRILSIKVGGKPMEKDAVYTVSACVREGDPKTTLCRLKNAKNIDVKDYTVHEVLEEYLKTHSPIRPKLDNRAIAVDLEKISFSTVPGTDYEFK